MNFKDKYTTEAIKAEIQADKEATPEVKEAENKKIVVSNEAMLSAEMVHNIINAIERSSRLGLK